MKKPGMRYGMAKKMRVGVKKNGMFVYSTTEVASVESTGGAGYAFERQIQTLLAVLMLCEGELAFAPGRKIAKIQFQVRRKGYNLGDIRLELVDAAGSVSQVLVQAKRTVAFKKTCEKRKTKGDGMISRQAARMECIRMILEADHTIPRDRIERAMAVLAGKCIEKPEVVSPAEARQMANLTERQYAKAIKKGYLARVIRGASE